LPAGHYELQIFAYNALSGVTQFKSLFGFVPTSGDSHLSTKTAFTYGEWVTDVVTFDLENQTEGNFQVGGMAISGGSDSNAKVFFDNITLTYTDPLQTAKNALQAEIDKAKLCDDKEGLASAIAAAEGVLSTATTEAELTDALAALQAADKDAVLRYENGLADATSTAGVLTSFVVNGDFTNNVSGWTATGGFQNNALANNKDGDFTKPFWENWNGSAKENKMYQTVVNIPNGTYKLKIAAFVNNLADPNDSQFVFANADKVYLKTGDPTFYEVWTVVTTNAVEIGLEQTTATANWMGIDNVSLTYYGAGNVIAAAQAAAHKIDWDAALAAANAALSNVDYDNVTGSERTALQTEVGKAEPTTADGYDAATAALVSATNAFVAAKANYDALVNENAKAAVFGLAAKTATTSDEAAQAVKDQKVAEYNYVNDNFQYGVELGEWVSSGVNTSAANFSNEHWSGETRTYKNQNDNNGQGWNASAWSISFSQDVTLPAGDYVFKVAGRQATGDQVTTSLVVKQGDTELGSVNDFPRGNASRGINKSGATSFDEADDQYANGGNGFGWEWRYVKFTLAADDTVNIAINAVATASHQWVSFGDYTVQTNNEANISLIAYNIALNDAITARDNTDYTNVIGDERTALVNAIAADKGTTKESIDAATAALNNAVSAFTAAKNSYDAFVAAKAVTYSDDLPYASSTKFAAISTAQAAADATSASDADAKTAVILSAYRKYVESNALAEGVTGAEVIPITNANMDVTYNSEAHTFGVWQVIGQTNGTIQLLDNQSFTDGDGNADYKYADIYKNDNNAGIQQTINLAPGKYLLTVTARANTTAGATFKVFAGSASAEIARIGNSGGTFDRGWNDASVEFTVNPTSDVNIGVQSGNGKDLWWSATRFRLVKIGEIVPATMTITAAQYATFIAPFDVTIPTDVTAVKITGEGTDGKLVEETVETTIPANTPVVLHSESVVDETFYGEPVAATNELTEGILTGTYTEITAPANSYILNKIDEWVGFATVAADNTTLTVGANRCYIKADAVTPAPFFRLGGTTNIANVEKAEADAAVYDLTGRRVDAPAKGIYIVNGKKVLVK